MVPPKADTANALHPYTYTIQQFSNNHYITYIFFQSFQYPNDLLRRIYHRDFQLNKQQTQRYNVYFLTLILVLIFFLIFIRCYLMLCKEYIYIYQNSTVNKSSKYRVLSVELTDIKAILPAIKAQSP